MNPRDLGRRSIAPLPRLLVALRPRDSIGSALESAIPDVPWRYATKAVAADLASVEALLVGSVERELGDFRGDRTPKLTFGQRASTGPGRVSVRTLLRTGSGSGNVGGFAPFVAEHAVMLALAAAQSLEPVTGWSRRAASDLLHRRSPWWDRRP